jgi:hypothetical protein
MASDTVNGITSGCRSTKVTWDRKSHVTWSTVDSEDLGAFADRL